MKKLIVILLTIFSSNSLSIQADTRSTPLYLCDNWAKNCHLLKGEQRKKSINGSTRRCQSDQ